MRWAPSGFRKKICPCKARRRTERTGKKYENRIHGLTVQRNLKPFVMQATAGGAPFLERRLSHRRALAAPQMARRFSRLPIKRRLQITTRTGGCPPGLPCRTAGNDGERQAKEQSNFQGGKTHYHTINQRTHKNFPLMRCLAHKEVLQYTEKQEARIWLLIIISSGKS